MTINQNSFHLLSYQENATVPHSGASKTVCGESLSNAFQGSLRDDEKREIQFSNISSQYKFGDGAHFTVINAANIPIIIG